MKITGEKNMKRIYLIMMLLGLFAIGALAQNPTPSPTPTPSPAVTAGAVFRVTYYKIKPGKLAEYIKFLREHAKPIYDEQKKQGLILDYFYFNQPTSDSPNDWDVAQVIVYRNYAEALDPNAERGAKFDAISLKHYGTAEERTKANDSLRDLRDVLSSHLMRQQILNPIQ
jgi:hypothetical protein